MRSSKKANQRVRTVALKRRELREGLLWARGAICEGCSVTPVGQQPYGRPWTDMHERLTRGRGGDPTDPGNILCLCAPCHKWVTEHETEARKLGLVRGRTAEEHRAVTRPWE